ncbi:hypothetical protein QV12_06555 [Pseudomonas putida]|nr:hypothetical protein QV12_06555 [Pseudomonas putida]KKK08038.1 hypothetical protein O162_35210 [Pseudomonas putida SJ3]
MGLGRIVVTVMICRLSGACGCSSMVVSCLGMIVVCRFIVITMLGTTAPAVLALMVVHIAFTAAVLVAAARGHQGLVLLGIHLGQLIQERDDSPDVLIAHALAPGGHARGFDTVLDCPECGGWIASDTHLGEVGWRRV